MVLMTVVVQLIGAYWKVGMYKDDGIGVGTDYAAVV